MKKTKHDILKSVIISQKIETAILKINSPRIKSPGTDSINKATKTCKQIWLKLPTAIFTIMLAKRIVFPVTDRS